MRLGRRQKQVTLDRFFVKVGQKEKESTDSSDSVSEITSTLLERIMLANESITVIQIINIL
jgi:hypothetical protein